MELSKTLAKILGDITYIRTKLETLASNKPEDWLTTAQVSLRYNISIRTLANYRQRRTLAYTHIGGKILYKRSDIEKLLERHRLADKTGA